MYACVKGNAYSWLHCCQTRWNETDTTYLSEQFHDMVFSNGKNMMIIDVKTDTVLTCSGVTLGTFEIRSDTLCL